VRFLPSVTLSASLEKEGLYFFPVSRTASGKSRRNVVAYAVAGALANLAEA